EYIAKNVGIYRAKGKFILVTNSDLLFNEELIKFLASKRLSEENFYRIDRYDVAKLVPSHLSVEEQLKFCEKNAFMQRVNNGYRWLKKFPQIKYLIYSIHFRLKTFLSNVKTRQYSKEKTFLPKPDILHMHTAGDFFLMARQYWEIIRGYPELESSYYIDGYPCFMAEVSGLKQIILKEPLKIYHQEHSRSLSIMRPSISPVALFRDGEKMRKTRQLIIYNSDNWGLNSEQLLEYKIKGEKK
ncbi:MAG: hypothetical protein HWN67_11230, partial [Candidatus Helarchaeota archaeon]|nr:hypothetical protein [Candidatus Helarchaeota archaeon]